jgi:hypothetical protein
MMEDDQAMMEDYLGVMEDNLEIMEDDQKSQNSSRLEPFGRVQLKPQNHGGCPGNHVRGLGNHAR